MGQVVIAGAERRRRWGDEERLEILAEAYAPGAWAAEISWRLDVSTSLVYTWRRKMLEAYAVPADGMPENGFAEAVMVENGASAGGAAPTMVIDLARGRKVSIYATAAPPQVAAVLKALR